jgi:hypothetical protein
MDNPLGCNVVRVVIRKDSGKFSIVLVLDRGSIRLPSFDPSVPDGFFRTTEQDWLQKKTREAGMQI